MSTCSHIKRKSKNHPGGACNNPLAGIWLERGYCKGCYTWVNQKNKPAKAVLPLTTPIRANSPINQITTLQSKSAPPTPISDWNYSTEYVPLDIIGELPLKTKKQPGVEEIIICQSDIAKVILAKLTGKPEVSEPYKADTVSLEEDIFDLEEEEDDLEETTESTGYKKSTQYVINDGTNMLFQGISALPNMQGFAARIQQMAPGSLKSLVQEMMEEEKYADKLDKTPATTKLIGLIAMNMALTYQENIRAAAVVNIETLPAIIPEIPTLTPDDPYFIKVTPAVITPSIN